MRGLLGDACASGARVIIIIIVIVIVVIIINKIVFFNTHLYWYQRQQLIFFNLFPKGIYFRTNRFPFIRIKYDTLDYHFIQSPVGIFAKPKYHLCIRSCLYLPLDINDAFTRGFIRLTIIIYVFSFGVIKLGD